MSEHTPLPRLKDAGDLTEPDGTYIPPTELHRFDCACGWRGSVWYITPERARRAYDRHVEGFAS